ncbi:MAG: Holliday junction resolvase RuvX [Anaerolineae bacterium]|nr:Holliday junction resolvase RuvX [Anaerolineae bacterium]
MIGPVMALDVGNRRIGVAVSDPMGVLATPIATLRRRSWTEDLAAIVRLAREREVKHIIIGYPLHMDGSMSEQAQVSERFAQRLRAALGPGGPPVELWDERMSTQIADERLREAGASGRAGLDAAAAAVILEEWLAARRDSPLLPPLTPDEG